MALIFKNPFCVDNIVVSEIAQKIKNTKNIEKALFGENNAEEFYKLDDIDICFNIIKEQIIITDKAGQIITNMYCYCGNDDYYVYNEYRTQKVKNKQYHKLLKLVQARMAKERKKQALDSFDKGRSKCALLTNVLTKIRSL